MVLINLILVENHVHTIKWINGRHVCINKLIKLVVEKHGFNQPDISGKACV
jgi:hypothetical protein